MGRSAKEYCRPDQPCDGGGAVNMGYTKQAGESEDTSEQTMGGKWIEKLFDAGVQYASAKALGKGIGDALDVGDVDE